MRQRPDPLPPSLPPPLPLPPRGIRNATNVSCHIACAIEILCHAVPPVRQALMAILALELELPPSNGDDETARKAEKANEAGGGGKGGGRNDGDYGDNEDDDGNEEAAFLMVKELVDYMDVRCRRSSSTGGTVPGQGGATDRTPSTDQPRGQAWDPRRLYSLLRQPSAPSSSAPSSTSKDYVLDADEVGDASTSLSYLLRRLQRAGPEWDALLQESVWGGRTVQVLQGTRRLRAGTAPGAVGEGHRDTHAATVATSRPTLLRRTKVAPKSRPMACPLVVRASEGGVRAAKPFPSTSTASMRRSLDEELQRLLEPQVVAGPPYPWDGLSPDSFTEQMLSTEDGDGADDKIGWDSIFPSDYDDDDDANNTNNNWVTTKRLELRRIPRVWLLHVDRRQLQERRPSQAIHMDERDGPKAPSIVDISLELETGPLVNAGATPAPGADAGHGPVPPSQRLVLHAAILQVWEEGSDSGQGDIWQDDGWQDDGWQDDGEFEGHCMTLLRTGGYGNNRQEKVGPDDRGDTQGIGCSDILTNDAHAPSWVLVDDEDCHSVDQENALKMMGGTMEFECNDNRSIGENASKFYAASLVVYAIPNDTSCNCLVEDIVKWWKARKVKPAPSSPEPSGLVGRRLRVKWAKGKFYSGTITHYNELTGKHRVTYNDGDVKEYNLNKKTIEWIDD